MITFLYESQSTDHPQSYSFVEGCYHCAPSGQSVTTAALLAAINNLAQRNMIASFPQQVQCNSPINKLI
jgi:hypothetical protein